MASYRPLSRTGPPPPKVADYAALYTPISGDETSPAVPRGGAAPGASERFITHVVTRADSIDGISLRYGISKATLKQVNDLPSDNIHTVRTLRIPLPGSATVPSDDAASKQASHAAILRRFKHAHGLGEEEARYYLSGADYDEAAAARELSSDLTFEGSAAAQQQLSAAGAGSGLMADSPVSARGLPSSPSHGSASHSLETAGASGTSGAATLLRHRVFHA